MITFAGIAHNGFVFEADFDDESVAGAHLLSVWSEDELRVALESVVVDFDASPANIDFLNQNSSWCVLRLVGTVAKVAL